MRTFTVSSKLDADAKFIADKVFRIAGVNEELMPLVKMQLTPEWLQKSLAQWPVGYNIHASWLLLFGLLPIDRHHFGLEQVTELSFREKSWTLVLRTWTHQRDILPMEGYSEVVDKIEMTTRLSWLEPLITPIYLAVFKHRHRRLQKMFGRVH